MNQKDRPATEVTICLILNGHPPTHILLGLKKTGLGCGKYVGPGGKVEPGEIPEEAAIREVREEIDISIDSKNLKYVGELTFEFPSKPEWNELAHVFLAREWIGDPVETPELQPFWFSIGEIPYEKMWDDYRFWLPEAIEGQNITARFVYSPDNQTVASMITGV